MGYPSLETPLVLMQWNSALAVTYPARACGIQRGDSWQTVAQKSKGECFAVHVPITTRSETVPDAATGSAATTTTTATATATAAAVAVAAADGSIVEVGGAARVDDSSSTTCGDDYHSRDEYDRTFVLTPTEQAEARQRDLHVRRFAEDGKACIERYRIASRRILETVQDCLALLCASGGGGGGGGGATLERASIDEFYVDVSDACARAACTDNLSNHRTKAENWDKAMQDTIIIGVKDGNEANGGEMPDTFDPFEMEQTGANDDNATAALRHGCWLAWTLRQAVRTKLGFTLSAGIAANKMLAKLSASYGKPNGQAVLFPQHVSWLLHRTDIRKCRNLGGKLGKRVQSLLPPNVPTTVGSLSRYVSLATLTNDLKLPATTARWLLEYVRGIDPEAVQQESVVKTITAFKNLSRRPPLPDCASWFHLLVQEIVTRVERDTSCHHRYPRFYQVQYHVFDPTSNKRIWQQSSKIWKAGFPGYNLSTEQKVQEINSKILPTIAAKEKDRLVRLDSIGLCAVDFIDRPPSKGRDYFAHGAIPTSTKKHGTGLGLAKDSTCKNATLKGLETAGGEEANDGAIVKRRQGAIAQNPTLLGPGTAAGDRIPPVEPDHEILHPDIASNAEDCDMKLAKKLQAEYDRENRIFQALERQKNRESNSKNHVKTRRIDSFFRPNGSGS